MNISNKKARFEYELTGEGVEAGISLLGAEAKSVREGRADISQSAVRILQDEVYLINANIPASGIQKYNSTRARKLLLHRGEILSLITKMKQRQLQYTSTMNLRQWRRITTMNLRQCRNVITLSLRQ